MSSCCVRVENQLKTRFQAVYARSIEPERTLKPKKISAPRAPEKGLTSVVNVCLCMGFVSDQLYNGKMFQTLTVLDTFSWERLAIYVDKSIKGEQIYEELEEIKTARGLQK